MKRFAFAIAACGAIACVQAPRFKMDDLAPVTRDSVQQVAIYNAAQLATRPFAILNVVEGISCKRTLLDEPASRSAAVEHAKYLAFKMGADGLTNLQFAAQEGTSYSTNCWDLIRVSAEAIKFAKP
jgi:hypothetical protein